VATTAYDPVLAYEMAVILDCGARAMKEEGTTSSYVMNENYAQPSLPEGAEGILSRASSASRRMVRRMR
jgi:pyruvate dehydrogenase E1 component